MDKRDIFEDISQKFNKSGAYMLLSQKKLLIFLAFTLILMPKLVIAAWGFDTLKAFLDVFREDAIEETASEPGEPSQSAMLFSIFPVSAGLVIPPPKNDPANAPNLSIMQSSSVISHLSSQGVFSDDIPAEITTYIVKTGDNLTAIAHSFGVTVNTILWANNISNARLIKPGDELIILPVSGIQYIVKKGDTIESIAKKFKGSVEEIAQFNGFALGEELAIGAEVIIPDGELQNFATPTAPSSAPRSSVTRFANLPELQGYYLRPIMGGRNARATKTNPRGLHGFNGVDLANTCGLPVLASAEGTVIIARAAGWNGGYGRYIVIRHHNGTQTLYAHLKTTAVAVGQNVGQGQEIGGIGSSGNSTGCHVHFEIRGAKNPF